MGKKIKYRKGNKYFKSHKNHTDYDEIYDTPSKELEWDQIVTALNEENPFPESVLGPTFEEQVREVVLQMIEDGIVKPGNEYEPPE